MTRVQRRIELQHPRHLVALGVLLEKQFATYARGRAHQRHWPALQVLHHQRPHESVIAHQVDLGGTARGIDHPVRMGHAQRGRQHGLRRVAFGIRRDLRIREPGPLARRRAAGRLGGLVHRRFVARGFVGDRHRRLVGAQALKHRMPHAPASRPFAERNFADQLRFDPMGFLRYLGIRGEWAGARVQGAQLSAQLAQGLFTESGTHVAGVAQRAVFAVDAQQQRADAGARALRVGVAADDEFLPLAALELDPVGGAPRHIGRVSALGDHAFQAQAARRRQYLLGRRVEHRAEPDLVLRLALDDALQHLAPILQGHVAQVVAGAIGKVEQVVDDRVRCAPTRKRLAAPGNRQRRARPA